MERWRDGEMKGGGEKVWRSGGMEMKGGGVEEWRSGGMKGWIDEGWRSGGVEGWRVTTDCTNFSLPRNRNCDRCAAT